MYLNALKLCMILNIGMNYNFAAKSIINFGIMKVKLLMSHVSADIFKLTSSIVIANKSEHFYVET